LEWSSGWMVGFSERSGTANQKDDLGEQQPYFILFKSFMAHISLDHLPDQQGSRAENGSVLSPLEELRVICVIAIGDTTEAFTVFLSPKSVSAD
jgi:hypothetical protein